MIKLMITFHGLTLHFIVSPLVVQILSIILFYGIPETHPQMRRTYNLFPRGHRRHIYTNNPLEAIMIQIRRRTRVVGAFPDGNSAVMLAATRLRHIAGTQWGIKRYMNMDRLKELKRERLAIAESMTG